MDDLDRLYQHLVATLNTEAPHLLRQRFTVGDLAQQLVPYRLHRRALGFNSIQQYDQSLLRLVAGERGYLATEPVVQDAARQGLAAALPEADALRRFPDAAAMLAPEPLRALLGDGTGAAAASAAPPPLAVTPVAATVPAPDVAPPAAEPAPAAARAAASAPAPTSSPEPKPASAMPFPTRPPAQVVGGPCRYCGESLPEGRPVTFCPYCGENVTIVRCPACSTELEIVWRFCITCGRVMDTATAPSSG